MVAALVESALVQCRQLEECGFHDIKVSLKAADVPLCVAAYRRFADETDYPLHLGITEAGTWRRGTVKSAAGLAILLDAGLGDTLRVSLTADPVEEIRVGILLLESLGLREADPELISCPTCGRTEIDLFALVDQVEREIAAIKGEGKSLRGRRIAVMGCVVNGPGEARDADLGLAGGKGQAGVFRHGERLGIWPVAEAIEVFRRELRKLAEGSS
jgi:(E)-4-hydroxy-3-methylbut-2-enyl-diphosphate synthase